MSEPWRPFTNLNVPQQTEKNACEPQGPSPNPSEPWRTSANLGDAWRTFANLNEHPNLTEGQRISANMRERKRTSANLCRPQRIVPRLGQSLDTDHLRRMGPCFGCSETSQSALRKSHQKTCCCKQRNPRTSRLQNDPIPTPLCTGSWMAAFRERSSSVFHSLEDDVSLSRSDAALRSALTTSAQKNKDEGLGLRAQGRQCIPTWPSSWNVMVRPKYFIFPACGSVSIDIRPPPIVLRVFFLSYLLVQVQHYLGYNATGTSKTDIPHILIFFGKLATASPRDGSCGTPK